MKKVFICLSCNKPVSKSLAYKVEMEKLIKNPLTGMYGGQDLKGHVCPTCNAQLGYKSSKKKMSRFTRYQDKSE